MSKKPAKTYSSGEPKESGWWVLGIVILVVVTAFMISFIGSGYGGTLADLILMLIRAGFGLAVPAGLVVMVIGLFKHSRKYMRGGLVMMLVGIVGFALMVVLSLIF